MSFSVTHLSNEFKVNLWREDPRFAEYTKLEEEAQNSFANFNNEKYKKFSEWNPMPQNSLRNFFELKTRIHPATVQEGRLFRINDTAIDIFRTVFTWKPKIAEEISPISLVGRYITFHTAGFPLFFKPNLAEVFSQLPESLIQSSDKLYFTTETIHDDAYKYTIGSNTQYHVAVTSVYEQN